MTKQQDKRPTLGKNKPQRAMQVGACPPEGASMTTQFYPGDIVTLTTTTPAHSAWTHTEVTPRPGAILEVVSLAVSGKVLVRLVNFPEVPDQYVDHTDLLLVEAKNTRVEVSLSLRELALLTHLTGALYCVSGVSAHGLYSRLRELLPREHQDVDHTDLDTDGIRLDRRVGERLSRIPG